jgi:hypothetical protein
VTSLDSDGLAIFARDAATGALTQRAGTAGCITQTGTGGACQDGIALGDAVGLGVSGDGKSLYVASRADDALAIFDRATPVPAGPPPPPPAPTVDTIAPGVSRLALDPTRFRVGPRATPKAAATQRRRRPARRGSRVRFRLSEKAAVRIAVERSLPGRRVGRRCKAPTPKLRKRRRCTRFKHVGTLTRASRPAGANSIPFSGRIGRRALAPGSYRVTVTATDPTGNRSKARRASFTIVRR